MTGATAELARVVDTPAGHFRLSYSRGNGPSSRDHVDTARRFGHMPDALDRITDIVADLCAPDGSRFIADPDAPNGRDRRPEVTVNGVAYTGTLYYVATGYYIGPDSYAGGDNGWCVDRGHYWTGQHMTRETARSYWQPITDAGLRKLSGYLAPDVAAMLADRDALRMFWRQTFESSADYAIADARRALELANAHLAWARRYGSSLSDLPVPDGVS